MPCCHPVLSGAPPLRVFCRSQEQVCGLLRLLPISAKWVVPMGPVPPLPPKGALYLSEILYPKPVPRGQVRLSRALQVCKTSEYYCSCSIFYSYYILNKILIPLKSWLVFRANWITSWSSLSTISPGEKNLKSSWPCWLRKSFQQCFRWFNQSDFQHSFSQDVLSLKLLQLVLENSYWKGLSIVWRPAQYFGGQAKTPCSATDFQRAAVLYL